MRFTDNILFVDSRFLVQQKCLPQHPKIKLQPTEAVQKVQLEKHAIYHRN